MTYQALYRTYRPRTFSDVVGQDVIVQTLKNAIINNKIAHAYLLVGLEEQVKQALLRFLRMQLIVKLKRVKFLVVSVRHVKPF